MKYHQTPVLQGDERERFWSKVHRSNPEQCWPWKDSLDGGGYGRMKLADGRLHKAHRLAFAMAHPKTDLTGSVLLHTCDNTWCVNPAHLKPGSHKDNHVDSAQKGRKPLNRGSRNGNSKFSQELVTDLVRESFTGASRRELSEKYGVSLSHVGEILNGDTWPGIVQLVQAEEIERLRARVKHLENTPSTAL